MSIEGKGTVFSMKLKLEGNCLKKDNKKENFEKDVVHLIETNHEINMTFEHTVQAIHRLESIWMLKISNVLGMLK